MALDLSGAVIVSGPGEHMTVCSMSDAWRLVDEWRRDVEEPFAIFTESVNGQIESVN